MSKARSLADLISGGAVIEASEIADSTITGAKLASDISITTTGTISTPSITGLSSLTIENVNIDNNSITSIASDIEQVSYTSVTTNIFTNSQTFNTGDWQALNTTVAVNNTTAPDGTTTANKITQNSGSTNVDLSNLRDVGLTSNSGTVYTISIHAKISANRNFLVINEHISSDAFRKTWFNLSNGTVGTNFSSHTATITDVGNGWYRCSITVTSTVTNTDSIIMFGPAETDGTHIITDNQGSMFFWGAQLEESATLTGYLTTTSASLSGLTGVTRGGSGTTAATASSGDTITIGNASTTLSVNITATQNYIPLSSLTGVAASGSAVIGNSNIDLNLSASGTGNVKLANDEKLVFGDAGENIVGDGTNLTISSSGTTTIDSTGNIILDGSNITKISSGGTEYLRISKGGTSNFISSQLQDIDLSFTGNDGGSSITALTLDMSEGGIAKFNKSIALGTDTVTNHASGSLTGVTKLVFGGDNDANGVVGGRIYSSGNALHIQGGTSGLNLRGANNNIHLNINCTTGNVGICCNLTVAGNLTINGTTTTLNTATLDIEDKTLCIAKGAADAAAANGAGLIVDGASACLCYTSGTDSWDFNKKVIVNGKDLLVGNSANNHEIALCRITSGPSSIKLQAHSNEPKIMFGTNGTGTYGLRFSDPSDNVLMKLTTTGKLGIGTSSPSQALTISGDANSVLISSNDYDLIKLGPRATSGVNLDRSIFQMYSDGVEINRLDSVGNNFITGGNVGIGTTAPTQKLTVADTSVAQIHLHSALPSVRFSSDTTGYSEATRAFVGLATGSNHFVNGSVANDFVVRGTSGNKLLFGGGSTVYGCFNNAGHFQVDLTTFNVDATNNRVGIGTTTPTQALTISGGNNAKIAFTGGGVQSLYFNDTDTSLAGYFHYQHSIDQFRMNTSGSIVLTGGNVGIGTTAPADTNGFGKALDIQGSSGAAIYVGSSGDRGIFGYASSEQHIINPSATGTTRFTINSSEKLRITSDGKVGIGTSSPTRTLHVDASAGANVEISRTGLGGLYLESDGTNGVTRSTSATGSLIFQTNGVNEKMRITSDGKVGIGTSAPSVKLDVRATSFTPYNTNTTLITEAPAVFSQSQHFYIYNAGSYNNSRPSGGIGAINSSNVVSLSAGSIVTANPGADGFKATSPNSSLYEIGNGDHTFRTKTGLTVGDQFTHQTRMIIKDSGFVGIGTTSPSTKLTIVEGGEPPASGMLLLQANSSSRQLRIQPPTDSDNGFIDFRGGNLMFMDDGTEVARFQGGGKFGIGTSSPASLLHVSSNGPVIKLTDTDTGATHNLSGSSSARNFDLEVDTGSTSGSPRFALKIHDGLYYTQTKTEAVFNEESNDVDFRVESNGNANMLFVDGGNDRVGIGTSSPTAKLQVDGNFSLGNLSTGTANSSYKQIQFNNGVIADSGGNNSSFQLLQNAYVGSGNNNYAITSGSGTSHTNRIMMTSGIISFARAYPTTADSQITYSESMRIAANGNVGIGTSAPSQKLDVVGNAEINGNIYNNGKLNIRKDGASEREHLVITNEQGGSNSSPTYRDIHFNGYSGKDRGRITVQDRSNNKVGGFMELQTARSESTDGSSLKTSIFLDNDGDIFFYEDTGTTAKVKWDATNERLGIGTTVPGSPLTVSGGTNSIVATFNNDVSATTDVQNVLLLQSNTTGTAGVGFGVGISFNGERNDGNVQRFGDIGFEASLNSGTSLNTDFFIKRYLGTEVFRVSHGGRITRDTTSTASGHGNFVGEVGASYKALAFEHTNGGGVVGSVTTGSSSTSYNTSSDYRLKENVDYTFDATTRLKQLKPARFNFITDTDTTVDGFLAHEVSSVVPEAISGTKDAVDDDGNPVYQGIDQSKLVPLLVKTIQELEARIKVLEDE
ncbi:tail fiber domain-containing protein [bacterium]|nr:tail fiber domain-containing protein [bacterium]